MNRHMLWPRLARVSIYLLLAVALVVPSPDAAVVRAASAISLRSVVSGNNGAGSTSLTLAKPSTAVAGDVLVAQMVVMATSTVITAPSGWSLIRATASGTAVEMATYYRVVTSAEPSSYKWTFGATETATGAISDLAGVNSSSPVDASSGKVNTGTATAAFAQITTTVPNDLLLAFVGVAGNTTITPPSGYTESYDRKNTGSSDGRTAEASRQWKSNTGTTAAGSAQEDSLAVTNVTQLVALRPAPAPITIVATGDMECETSNCNGVGTVEQVAQIAPSAFFPVGDLIFYGTANEYNNYYDPSFGQYRSFSYPAMGNHDGTTSYYDYWNGIGNQTGRAGTRGQGWYSFSKGSWHFVLINSNCVASYMQVSCQPGSAEINWLQSDLAAHPNLCTIAFMHYPYYTSGDRQYPELQTIFQTLYNAHVELLITGHTHYYQRFYPQDANGNQVSNGVTEIVVGTGGGDLASMPSTATYPNQAVQIAGAFGVLKLVLNQGSYSFQFLPAPGSVGTDSGSAACH